MYSFIKNIVRKIYDRNEAFNKHLRKLGAIIGKDVQVVDRFNFLFEPWFANLIEIGNGVVIAAGVRFVSHDSSYANVFGDMPVKFGRISIGNDSYIGVNSIILPGVSIGESCLIGAGSIVNRDIPSYSIAVGNPAHVIGDSRDGLKRFESRVNENLDDKVFYLDVGGSFKQQKLKTRDTISEVLRIYRAYSKEHDV